MRNVFNSLLLIFTCVNMAAQEPRLVLPTGHSGSIILSEFSYDSKLLLTNSKDRNTRIWDSENGTLLATVKNDSIAGAICKFIGRTYSVSFKSAADQVTIVSDNFYRSSIVKLPTKYIGYHFVGSDLFRNRIIYTSDDNNIYVWDTLSKAPVKKIKAHATGMITVAALSASEKYFVTVASDSSVKVWNTDDWSEKLLPLKLGRSTSFPVFSNNEKYLVLSEMQNDRSNSAVKRYHNCVYDLAARKIILDVVNQGRIAISKDDHLLCYMTLKELMVLDLRTGNPYYTIKNFNQLIESDKETRYGIDVTFFTDSNFVLVLNGGNNFTIDVANKRGIPKKLPAYNIIQNVLASRDGKHLVSTYNSGIILLNKEYRFISPPVLRINCGYGWFDKENLFTFKCNDRVYKWDMETVDLKSALPESVQYIPAQKRSYVYDLNAVEDDGHKYAVTSIEESTRDETTLVLSNKLLKKAVRISVAIKCTDVKFDRSGKLLTFKIGHRLYCFCIDYILEKFKWLKVTVNSVEAADSDHVQKYGYYADDYLRPEFSMCIDDADRAYPLTYGDPIYVVNDKLIVVGAPDAFDIAQVYDLTKDMRYARVNIAYTYQGKPQSNICRSAIAVSKKGKYLVAAICGLGSRVWNCMDGNYLFDLEKTPGFVVRRLAITGDDKYIIGYGYFQGQKAYSFVVWDTETRKVKKVLTTLPDYDAYSSRLPFYSNLVVNPCKDQLAYVANNGNVYNYDITQDSSYLLYSFASNPNFGSLSFSPFGKFVVATGKSYNMSTSAPSCLLFSTEDHQKKLAEESGTLHFSENDSLLAVNAGGYFNFYRTEGMLHLYKLILTDSFRYVAINKNGYYHSTRNMAQGLYYITKDLERISFAQLDVKYNRPDKVLESGNPTDTALVAAYRRAYYTRLERLEIDSTLFRNNYIAPKAFLVDKEKIKDTLRTTDKLKLHIICKGNSSTIFDRFNIWVNEVPVFGSKGIGLKPRKLTEFDTTIVITLSVGENQIETSIRNINGVESYRSPITVIYAPAQPENINVYFVGIGTDRYLDTTRNLHYCVKDVRDILAKFKEKYKDNLKVDTLFNKSVTVERVKAIRQKLYQGNVNDIVIVYYCGHGKVGKGPDYFLSTYNMDFENPEHTGLHYYELENLLDSIKPRRKLMFIDACNSGELDKNELKEIGKRMEEMKNEKNGVTVASRGIVPAKENKLGSKRSIELMKELFIDVGRNTGATIISAASGVQPAFEDTKYKNGLFTYCILELLNKKTGVTVAELKKYVSERVYELSNKLQQPTTRGETQYVNWELW